jgi:hypothetical protein
MASTVVHDNRCSLRLASTSHLCAESYDPVPLEITGERPFTFTSYPLTEGKRPLTRMSATHNIPSGTDEARPEC